MESDAVRAEPFDWTVVRDRRRGIARDHTTVVTVAAKKHDPGRVYLGTAALVAVFASSSVLLNAAFDADRTAFGQDVVARLGALAPWRDGTPVGPLLTFVRLTDVRLGGDGATLEDGVVAIGEAVRSKLFA